MASWNISGIYPQQQLPDLRTPSMQPLAREQAHMAETVPFDADSWVFGFPDTVESQPDSVESQAAIALKGSNDQEVQCWLAFSRKGGFQLPTSDHRLPQNVVDAYRVLQGYDDLVVLRWIHEAQSRGGSEGDSNKPGRYWCTSCLGDKPYGYKYKDDWRREEKEHEETYICMHRGALESTDHGFVCAFCGIIGPDNSHFACHNVYACESQGGARFSCKRRCDMVNHLARVHGISSRVQGEKVATTWKHGSPKQAWACGFCVSCFSTFPERLKHLQAHFEHGMTLDDWDRSKVIQGLLEQPALKEGWKAKVATMLPGAQTWSFVRTNPNLKDLQRKLEEGPLAGGDNAEVLVDAAFTAYRSQSEGLII